jgi:hypothetical protein
VQFSIAPPELELTGPGDGCQLAVTRVLPDGTTEDVTRACRFEAQPAGAVEFAASGYVRANAPGMVAITAYHESAEAKATLTVREAELPVSDFALDIVPILTKAGCNSGQCHGAAQGKGGLQLSLFGYDPEADYATLTRDLEGRRLDRSEPEASLLLMKPSLGLPHGGRLRLRSGSAEYDRVRRWIEAGTPWRDEERGRLKQIVVEPADRFLATAPTEQQIQVIAEYSDGTRRDATRLCLFVSNNPATVTVDKHGLARMLRRGQADVVVRFANKVATVRLAAPFNDRTDFDFAAVPRRNFIDDRSVELLEYMRLPVSPRSSDSEFLRRVYFDLVGHLPDSAQREDAGIVEDFLADSDPAKRDKLIEKLLVHPDFVLFWSLKLGDHLQLNSATMGTAAGSYRIWLAGQLKPDKYGKSTSYDQFVRTLLLAKGSLKGRAVAPAVYFAAPQEPGEVAEQVARRFLGVRIRCARCHDHPLDVWTQDDYYGFASFFGKLRVEAENTPFAQEVKLVEENSVRHPRSGETPPPKFLGGETAEVPDAGDAREALVDWMLSPENARFARMAANWVWAHLTGRGLVEPVDDLRATNPPTNPRLLDELAEHFRETGFDLRALIRTICQSETYQRSSVPLEGNEHDEQFYSHALLKPLTAHQMADAIAIVTGVPHSLGQTRAASSRTTEINDPNLSNYLLDVLGRCDRTGGCEVGAMARPASLKLALHLILGDAINERLRRLGKQSSIVTQMSEAARQSSESEFPELRRRQIESIYLRAYCRPPTEQEMTFWEQSLGDSEDYAIALQDMVWAMLNSREFAFNH